MHHYHEIVRVLNGKTLIDPESYVCTYFTREEGTLAPGYYVVLWPPDVVTPRYDHYASYIGPFKLELHAKIMARRYESGYVVENRPAEQSDFEARIARFLDVTRHYFQTALQVPSRTTRATANRKKGSPWARA